MKQLEFENEGQKVRARLYEPASPSKNLGIIFIHGWTGRSNDNAAAKLAELGYLAMTLDLRGHGNSEGDINKVNRADALADATKAYDVFLQNIPHGTRVGVVGNSYGGYIALLLSQERDVDCLSIRVPANYMDEGFDGVQMGQGNQSQATMKWRNKKLGPDGSRALKAINNFDGYIQILESENDDVIPHQTVQNYVDAVRNKSKLDYHLLKDWPHSMGNDSARNEEFMQILSTWLEKIA